jgi:6-phosphogluconolactonase
VTTAERRVLIHPDPGTLAATVAARTIIKLVDVLDTEGDAALVLTGGGVGTAVLRAIADSPARDSVDWSRVSFWWGDERFVARDSDDRNETAARRALLDHIAVDERNVHPFGSADDFATVDEAAEAYAAELASAAPEGRSVPRFDITFLGVGPDGHIASLFPNLAGIRATDRTVVGLRDAPKPPPERLSLTLPVINGSQRVFLVLAGPDKAAVLGLALAGASTSEVPVAGVLGIRRTVFFVDQQAAAEVPETLIAPVNYWTGADE